MCEMEHTLMQLFGNLTAPFGPRDVKSRPAGNGRHIRYVTARTVMNRLDNVLGPLNWWDDYIPGENSVMCRLTLRMPDGSTITKVDAGGYAGMADSGDDDKSGYSDAFKRAAVKFGIGRELYGDGTAHYGEEGEDDPGAPPPGRGEAYEGEIPSRESVNRDFAKPRAESGHSHGVGNGSVPRTGKAMFAWTKDQEQRHGVGLLKYLNNWAKLQEFPARMIDWDADQVALAYQEASRKLQTLSSAQNEAYEEAISS